MRFEYIVEPPLLTSEEELVRIEWYVNTKNDFTGTPIVNDNNGPNDKFSIEFNYNFIESIDAFAKAKFIIHNKITDEFIEETTAITRFTQDTNIVSNLYDVYPIDVEVLNDNHYNINSDYIMIELGDDKFYRKSATRVAVNYKFKDIYGNIIYSRDNDIDNLNSIKLDIFNFKNYPVILLSVQPVYNIDLNVPETIVPIIFNKEYHNFSIGNSYLKYGINEINIDNFDFVIERLNYRLFNELSDEMVLYQNDITVGNNGIFTISIPDELIETTYKLVIDIYTRQDKLYRDSFKLPLIRGV